MKKWKVKATDETWAAWAEANTADGQRKPAWEERMFRTKKKAEHEARLVLVWAAYRQGLNGLHMTASAYADEVKA